MGVSVIDFNLSFTYEDETQKALDNIDGKIEKGKCVVLCGNCGCGKSTFVRTINRLIPQFYEGDLSGYSKINGKGLETISIGEVGEIVSSVFQDPRSQFFTTNSCTEMAFALENYGVERDEIINKIDAAFKLFSLERLRDRKVFDLSSGERQLVAILCMWVQNTDICVLDEPTANLDFTAIKWLSQALNILKQQGKTLVINEHRLYYLMDIADEFWHMKNGKIVEIIAARDMKKYSTEDLNQMGLRTNSLDKLAPRIEQETPKEKLSVSFNNICFKYKNADKNVLDNFTYKCENKDITAIVGVNGAGKTTLGKLISGLVKKQSGDVVFQNKILSNKELIKNCVFIMQEAEFQFFTNSVYNELTYGREKTKELDLQIENILKRFDMWELRNRHPFSLSGGQMQKLSILIAYFSQKPIVILDEPTAGLDYISLKNCVNLINELKEEKIVLVITHDLELISKLCNKAVFISEGKNAKEFTIDSTENFFEFKNFMEKNIATDNKERTKKDVSIIDPRIKLLIFLNSLIAVFCMDTNYITTSFCATALLMLFEKRLKSFAVWAAVFLAAICAPFYLTAALGGFILRFFPVFILLGATISAVAINEGAAKMIAALRKFRINEKIIMIFSVVFRFFPVLKSDLKTMLQAIKTRGFFIGVTEKIKHLSEFMEILIVPLSFRVIRIAEALAASAQVRGIDLNKRRTSYIEIKFSLLDVAVFIIFITLSIIGILI